MTEKEKVRQLILSDDHGLIELGLILNHKFKYFPQLARFYKKHQKSQFWKIEYAVKLHPDKFNLITSVLCAELKSGLPWIWIDTYRSPSFLPFKPITELRKFSEWHNYITKKKVFFIMTRVKPSGYKTHPYTNIFR